MKFAIRLVEGFRDGWQPDPSLFPGYNFVCTSPVAVIPGQPWSNHAIGVCNYLIGPDSPAKTIITDVFTEHFSWFSGKTLGNMRVWIPSPSLPISPYPTVLLYDNDPDYTVVINASYGEAVGQTFITGSPIDFYPEQNLFARLKTYLDNTQQVMVAALPDLGAGYDSNGGLLNFPGSSLDIISVGSLDFGHEMPNGRIPDCCAYGYTSFASPQVASLCVVLINEFYKIKRGYTRQIIKDLILEGCSIVPSPYPQGAGLINLNKSLQAFSNTYGSIILPDPPAPPSSTPPPPIIPPPVVITPPIIVPLPKPLNSIYKFADPSFAIPAVPNGELYLPPGSPWSFSINLDSGIASDIASITADNDRLPPTSQVAFIINQGWISQTITLPIGWYHLRTIYSSKSGIQQIVRILMNGLVVGTLSTSNRGYIVHYSIPFYSDGAPMPVTYQGQNKIAQSTLFIARAEMEVSARPANQDILRANAAMMVGGSYNALTGNFIVATNMVDVLNRVLQQGT